MSNNILTKVVKPAPTMAGKSQERAGQPSNVALKADGWGKLPWLSALIASGLVLVAISFNGGRSEASWAVALYWTGLTVMYLPVAFRLVSGQALNRESVVLLAFLALALYLVKVLHSPLFFTNSDEFLHWRTAIDIEATGHLFTPNSQLPMSALYPGLEIVTSAVKTVTGLSFFTSGIIVIGVGRLILVLALYLLAYAASRSVRLAGLATLIYLAHPNYVYFNSDFSYESLSVPLAAVALYAQVKRQSSNQANKFGYSIWLVLVLGAVITTHHITSFALTALLLLWAVVHFVVNRNGRFNSGPGRTALFSLILCVSWLLFISSSVVGYLSPHLGGAVVEMIKLIRGEQSGRQLFRASNSAGEAAGQVAALEERVISIGAVALILMGLLVGLLEVWRRYRHQPFVLTMAICVLAYPLSLAFRLTGRGWESANRASAYLFVAIGIIVAIGLISLNWRGLQRNSGRMLLSLGFMVMFAGGIMAGWPPQWRLPGPYQAGSDTRSVEIKGISAAQWARTYLGPGHWMAADRTNKLLLGTFGVQNLTTTLSGGINPGWILYAPALKEDQLNLIKKGQLEFLVVDYRLNKVPNLGKSFYPNVILDQAIKKFDRQAGMRRIFDDGDILIYDLRELSGVKFP